MPESIALSVLLLAAIPACRLLGRPGMWGGRGRARFAAIGGLAGYGTFLGAACYFIPSVLVPSAVLVAAAGGVLAWRARPSFGAARGLPPGTLGLVDSLRYLHDDRYYRGQAAKYGPVFKMSQFHRPVACITDIPLALNLFQEHEKRLDPPPLRFGQYIPRHFVRYMKGEDHRYYRDMLKSIIRPEIMCVNEDVIRTAARKHLGRMQEASRNGQCIQPMIPMAEMTFEIFPPLFFGLHAGNPALEPLQGLYRRLNMVDPQGRYKQEVEEILCGIEDIIVARAAELVVSGSDTPSSFLEALVVRHAGAVDDVTLRRNLLFLMRISRAEVAGLLTWIWYFVSRHSGVLEAVRAEEPPGRLASWRMPVAAADRIVLETLRLEQSEYLYREATEDINWNGFLIPKGWLVRVCTRDAHQQARHFPDPERFDPDRFGEGKRTLNEYAPFGADRHSCIGTHLVFSVARWFLYELADGYEVEMTGTGGRHLGARHWLHWRPDGSNSVRVIPRRSKGVIEAIPRQ